VIFTSAYFFFCDFIVLVRHCFICCLCAKLFVFLVLFDSNCQISFDQEKIQSMTLMLSTLHIRSHVYFGDLDMVIFAGLSTLWYYVINMNIVNLFVDSSFLFANSFFFIVTFVLYRILTKYMIYTMNKKIKYFL
jgi:hypothetical protein